MEVFFRKLAPQKLTRKPETLKLNLRFRAIASRGLPISVFYFIYCKRLISASARLQSRGSGGEVEKIRNYPNKIVNYILLKQKKSLSLGNQKGT